MLTKEQLQERAQLVRIHEANCQIEYPTAEEANFRLAIMKQLGLEFRLKEVRAATITGPVTATAHQPVGPRVTAQGVGRSVPERRDCPRRPEAAGLAPSGSAPGRSALPGQARPRQT